MTQKQKELASDKAKYTLLHDYKIGTDKKLLIVIKSVSRSGMSRRMRVLVDNKDISYYIADLCGLNINDTGLQITGCGMDMTFWLADYITNCLWNREERKKLAFRGNGGSCLEWQAI